MRPTSKKTVIKMREEYERTIRKTATENLKRKFPDRPWIEDATSAWVSRKDLEGLLNANNADGLRIYYGVHNTSTNSNPRNDFNGLHSLLFVATKDSADPQNPTTETSVDQLDDAGTGDEEPTDYEGAAGTDVLLCPPIC